MKMELYYLTEMPFGTEFSERRIYVAGPFGTYQEALEANHNLQDSWKYYIDTQVVELV